MNVFMQLRISPFRSRWPGVCPGKATPKGTASLALLVAVLVNLPMASEASPQTDEMYGVFTDLNG